MRSHPRVIAGMLGLSFVFSMMLPASNANASTSPVFRALPQARARLPQGVAARPQARRRATSADGCAANGLGSFVAIPNVNDYAFGGLAATLGGQGNQACQTSSSIAAGMGNVIGTNDNGSYSFIGGGLDNAAIGTQNFLGGGSGNSTSGQDSVVVGGSNNAAQGDWSTVVGGIGNTASGAYSFVGSAYFSQAEGDGSFIGSGGSLVPYVANTVSGTDAFLGAGDENTVSGIESFVGGGESNGIQSTARYAAIAGGYNNQAYSTYAFLGSGLNNQADGSASAVVAGSANQAYGNASFVGAGERNGASGNGSFVGAGGYIYTSIESGHNGETANQAIGMDSFVGAGDNNFSYANDAFLGAGDSNNIGVDAVDGTLAGGNSNDLTGQKATIGGGESNKSEGSFATVPGGYRDEAIGNESFAAGSQAEARYAGSFVWSDYVSSEKPQVDSHAGEFVARASGGVYFFSNAASSAGVHLASGSGSWSSLSDRNAKTDVAPMDDASTLAKVVALPISTWRYKTESGVRHAGPMAQDFYAAFGVGEDDKHITSIDEDGVALSAIKALHTENRELRTTVAALQQRLAAVEARLSKR